MKTLALILTMSLSYLIHSQEVEKIVATYDHNDDYIYYFTDDEGHELKFEKKDEKAWGKYDLIVGDYYGKKFEITYSVEIETDKEGEETFTSTIHDLKLLD